MKYLIILLVAPLISGCTNWYTVSDCNQVKDTKIENKPKVEYELELVNQDTVRVKSLSTGKTYRVRFEEIQEVLLQDNL